MPEWTAGNRNLVGKDLVVWYAFGVTHGALRHVVRVVISFCEHARGRAGGRTGGLAGLSDPSSLPLAAPAVVHTHTSPRCLLVRLHSPPYPHTFAVAVVRVEDFPIMPVEHVSFKLKVLVSVCVCVCVVFSCSPNRHQPEP